MNEIEIIDKDKFCSDCSISQSSDCSTGSILNNENENSYNENKDKNYEIRCEKCYSKATIKYADYLKNKFIIICNNKHENIYYDYESFKENAYKALENLLCGNCKSKNNNNLKLYKCNDCNIFLCNECLNEHKEKLNHSDFIELKDIDINSSINFINDLENQDINKVSQKIIENLLIIDNMRKAIDDWIKELNTYYINYLNCFKNYYLNYEKIINNLKNEKVNYELFHKNQYKIDNYLKDINNIITNNNNKKKDIRTKSEIFLELFKGIEKKQIFSLIYNEKEQINYEEEINKVDISSFCPFKNNQFMLNGTKNGEIQIYDLPDKKIYKIQKIFSDEVKYISELGDNLFAAARNKNEIKIVKYDDENSLGFSIIQSIYGIDNIYAMISLPEFSSKKNGHYFCVSSENHILIYKSSENDGGPLFQLINDIKLNTIAHCLIEIDGKYLAAGCSQEHAVIFFDMENDFTLNTEIKDIKLTCGNNIFSLIHKKFLLVACTDGFKLIYLKKLKLYKSIHCRYSVFSVEALNENSFICCCYDKNEIKVKKYNIDKDNRYQFVKICDVESNNEEIWKLQNINSNIYYVDGKNKMKFFN